MVKQIAWEVSKAIVEIVLFFLNVILLSLLAYFIIYILNAFTFSDFTIPINELMIYVALIRFLQAFEGIGFIVNFNYLGDKNE